MLLNFMKRKRLAEESERVRRMGQVLLQAAQEKPEVAATLEQYRKVGEVLLRVAQEEPEVAARLRKIIQGDPRLTEKKKAFVLAGLPPVATLCEASGK